MTVTIDPRDPRTVRALAVLATADRWVRGHRRSDGRPFFIIPGSKAGTAYYTDTRACTCPDKNDPRRKVDACKHVLAVRMWKLLHDVDAPAPARATCAVCTQPVRSAGDECDACAEFLATVDGVAGLRLAAGGMGA